MNKNITLLIGATIGAGVGYLIADWYIEFQMPTEDEENFELSDFDLTDRGEKFQLKPSIKKERHRKSKQTLNYSDYFQTQNRPDLARLAAKYEGTLVNDEPKTEELDEDNTEVDTEVDSDDIIELLPTIIDASKGIEYLTKEQYHNSPKDYAQISLNYYDDEVVTDEEDQPINRPEKLLGREFGSAFGRLLRIDQPVDDDIIYISNDSKKAMYEILRLNKNYAAPRIEKPTRRRPKEETLNDEETRNA